MPTRMHSEKCKCEEHGDILWALFFNLQSWELQDYGLPRQIIQEKTRKSASVAQPTKRETAKYEVQTVQGFTVEQSRDACFF